MRDNFIAFLVFRTVRPIERPYQLPHSTTESFALIELRDILHILQHPRASHDQFADRLL